MPRPGRRAAREARGAQGAVVRRGGQVQRTSAGGSQHLGDADAAGGRICPRTARPSPTTRAPPRSGMGAAVEIRGQSFSVLAEVTVDTADARGRAVQTGRRPRRPRAVRAGRPAALRLQLHGRGRTDGVRARPDSVGQPRLRRALRQDGHGGGQPHPARRGLAVRRRRDGRHDGGVRAHPARSGSPAAESPSAATRARPSRAATRRRSRSPAGPSRRSSSTSRVRRTWTWNENWRRRSRRTDGQALP